MTSESISREEIWDRIEYLSQKYLETTAKQALLALRAGELHGTLIEAELKNMLYLLNDKEFVENKLK